MIETLVGSGCKRVDLFFMIGLPHQDYPSVMETVDYCGELMTRFGGQRQRRVLPLIAPLAPFIDPGSAIFEDPEKYGYRFFYTDPGGTPAGHAHAELEVHPEL